MQLMLCKSIFDNLMHNKLMIQKKMDYKAIVLFGQNKGYTLNYCAKQYDKSIKQVIIDMRKYVCKYGSIKLD